MKIINLSRFHHWIIILPTLMLIVCCKQQTRITKNFKWDEQVKALTGGHLDTWLRKAPFQGEFGKSDGKTIVMTNADQVFPFKGRYYNEVEELEKDFNIDTVIFREAEVLYQDKKWGDLFLQATLLYDDQEVFLKDNYWEMGSPLFGGLESATEMNRSTLLETSIFAKHLEYKTGIYWAWANYKHYLLGFYQKGQLVFETVVPLLSDTLETLNKLKEINSRLGLNIPEWENAKQSDLKVVEKPTSFWQDPFVGIYATTPGSGVYLNIKGTPFTQDFNARKGDYYFSYPTQGGDVFLYTVMQKTELDKEAFCKKNRKMDKYKYHYDDIFYEEHPEKGYVRGTSKAYFKGHQFLEIHFGYPQNDNEAKKQVHSVLKYIKLLNYEG